MLTLIAVEGLSTFAAFLFVEKCLNTEQGHLAVGCRSYRLPIWIFKKIQLEGSISAYNKAKEEKKWRLWKEAEEKQLRNLGVNEDDIEKLRIHDWAILIPTDGIISESAGNRYIS